MTQVTFYQKLMNKVEFSTSPGIGNSDVKGHIHFRQLHLPSKKKRTTMRRWSTLIAKYMPTFLFRFSLKLSTTQHQVYTRRDCLVYNAFVLLLFLHTQSATIAFFFGWNYELTQLFCQQNTLATVTFSPCSL